MDVVSLVSEFVAVPSVSSQSNIPVANVMQGVLERLGFALERLDFVDPAGISKTNLVGKLGTGTGGIAYFAHNDVVPADSWSRDPGPFVPTICDGRLYGRGSCDMKGSLAAFLAACDGLSPASLVEPVYVIVTADEEVGFRGAAEVVARSRYYQELATHGTRGLIGEPTELEVVHAHKGTYGFKAISRGKAAHSSTRDGLNANLAMIPFLADMKVLHDETLSEPRWLNQEFEPPWMSWNIGINDHTHAVNITAPQSVCTVYYRPMPGQQPEELLERARASAARHGIEFEVTWQAGPLYTNPERPFVRELLVLTGNAQSKTVSYGTDGVMYSAIEDLVVLGPGSIRQAHTDDEWVSLEQLSRGVETYRRIISRWCQAQT